MSELRDEHRELVVTVSAIFDLAQIEREYVEALSPDGGFSGSMNAWIEDYALGQIAEMKGTSDCRYEESWRLRAPEGESA